MTNGGTRFGGRSVVVTGGTSGIGRAIAVAFGKEGANVVVAGRNQEGGEETVELVEKAGGKAVFVRTDVTVREDLRNLVHASIDAFGRISILVNNAGMIFTAPIIDVTDEQYDLVMATNLTSAFILSRDFARHMIEEGRGGRIINISSIHAVLSEPNAGPYTASKGGMEAFSRTLATELAPHKITVNCIRSGAVWTALTAPLYTPEIVAALKVRIPVSEIGQPETIAFGVLYFASDEAWYSTGTTLAIDGGYIMDGSLPGVAYR
jgi:NAD(P)-dependent dehydrogenase (short-subunit alcohol dehydrogenase family)